MPIPDQIEAQIPSKMDEIFMDCVGKPSGQMTDVELADFYGAAPTKAREIFRKALTHSLISEAMFAFKVAETAALTEVSCSSIEVVTPAFSGEFKGKMEEYSKSAMHSVDQMKLLGAHQMQALEESVLHFKKNFLCAASAHSSAKMIEATLAFKEDLDKWKKDWSNKVCAQPGPA